LTQTALDTLAVRRLWRQEINYACIWWVNTAWYSHLIIVSHCVGHDACSCDFICQYIECTFYTNYGHIGTKG